MTADLGQGLTHTVLCMEVNVASVEGVAGPGPGHAEQQLSPYLPHGGPKAARDLDVKMVHDVVDDVSPVVASRRGHCGDSGQPDCLEDKPDSATFTMACGQH